MKSQINKKAVQFISIILVLLISKSVVFAYPPDNAAVLYYRSAYTFTYDSKKISLVKQYLDSEIENNQEIIDYVLRSEHAMKQFIDAGNGKYCDWGLDYSEGMNLLAPPLAEFRALSWIVLADAKMANEAAEYDRAIDLCISNYQAAAYIADGALLVSRLVGIAMYNYTNQVIIDILPNIADNPDVLTRLKNQIDEVSQGFPSLKTSIKTDLEICIDDINKESIQNLIITAGDTVLSIPENIDQILENADEGFIESNKEYMLKLLGDCLAATDLPYPQAYKKLDELIKKPEIESKENSDAVLATFLMPALVKVLSVDVRYTTHFNAIQTALNLYINRTETGKLPDKLPEGMPKDMFSGEDFIYEKTDDGFVLKCQGKDLSKDETYEYKFKVKK
ncbi:MAG: hypothetical protein JXA96_13700 [Sedimentisphaerales bacterium]|nr:hypothetical protein [Sedimentisphaerales bacterium]